MSADMETMDPAQSLMHQLWADRLLPLGVGRPSVNRRTAFHVYRDMGPQRSLAALARALEAPVWERRVGMAKLRAWSRAEEWPRACAAWDAEQADRLKFDYLAALERIYEWCMATISYAHEEEESCAIKGESLTLVMELGLQMAERIVEVRRSRAAEAQRTNAGRRDLQDGGGTVQVPSYTCGSHDDRAAPEPAQAARYEGEDLGDNDDDHGTDDDGDDLVDDVWDDVGAGEDDEITDGTSDETLADLVGCRLPELPEEYRNALRPGDGVIRYVLVRKVDGYVVLMVKTDQPGWVPIKTDVPCG